MKSAVAPINRSRVGEMQGSAARSIPSHGHGAAIAPRVQSANAERRVSHVAHASKKQAGRWKGMDAGVDISDDQQDIARGRQMVDSLYQGFGGAGGTHNAIMSSQDYISQAQRNYNNVEDGFYISPAFLDKMAIHVAKNFMDLPKIKVPLILGIWGGKGQGKTFQVALAFKKLGISPIVMSAGELESGNAGEPAKLIRQRYREASDVIRKGKMCALFINDLDAGAGRFGLTTQYTVNNQMVNATLMNIADNPTNVQLPGVYKNEEIPRVPIICTGNDFSTLYAPLIRDGRMEKYYWNPTREDRVGICKGIFAEDGITDSEVETLVDTFPTQSIDFFGALRARVYDDKVREFVKTLGFENIGKRLINSKEGKVQFDKPQMGLHTLLKYGKMLVEEQENIKRVQLADAYLAGAELAGEGGSSLPEEYEGLQGKLPATPVVKRSQSPPPPQRSPSPPPPAPKETVDKLEKTYSMPAAERFASPPRRAESPAPSNDRAPSAGPGVSIDLTIFKVDDLQSLARKKGVTLARGASKDDFVRALQSARVGVADLSRGQLIDVCIKNNLPINGNLDDLRARVSGGAAPAAPTPRTASPSPARWSAPAAPTPSAKPAESFSSPSRFQSPQRYGSSVRSPAPAPGKKLTEAELSVLRIDDLTSLARKRNVEVGRSATRDSIVKGLIAAGVTTGDCSKGQIAELTAKAGMRV